MRARYLFFCAVPLLTAFLLSGPTARAQGASFQGLGDLKGGGFNSKARDVSADGSVVVGVSDDGAVFQAPFRWTTDGGMVGLGDLPLHAPSPGSEHLLGGSRGATGVSGDGAIVVGTDDDTGPEGNTQAWWWTAATEIVGLGFLNQDSPVSEARAVSADGAVIVGFSTNEEFGIEAFQWMDDTMTGIGFLSDDDFGSSFAEGVSADGQVIVGVASSPEGFQAFRWTQATEMVGLDDLPGGGFSSVALGVSADGRVVVGEGVNPQGQGEAWRAMLSGGHRWIDPTGGSWDVASNWSPATVPGPDVTFDLDATYTVTGGAFARSAAGSASGARTVLRLSADDGRVDFELDNVNLVAVSLDTPSLAVSRDATSKIIAGTSTMVDAVVGFLPNAPGDTTTTAHLQVFNAGTTLNGSGTLTVGGAAWTGRGEVFVAAGRLSTRGAVVGSSSIGEAVVGNHGEWTVTEAMTVGLFDTGRLQVEAGGSVIAASLSVNEFADGPDHEALVAVAGTSGGQPSRLLVFDTLAVGGAGAGTLRVNDGGEVTVGHLVVGHGTAAGEVHAAGDEDGFPAHIAANSIAVGTGGVAFHALVIGPGGRVDANGLVIGTENSHGAVHVDSTSGARLSGLGSVHRRRRGELDLVAPRTEGRPGLPPPDVMSGSPLRLRRVRSRGGGARGRGARGGAA